METSVDVRTILNRCRMMNCLYEGQSFSPKSFSGACGEPDRSDLALEDMVEQALIVKNAAGAYSLTAEGAAMLKTSTAAFKQQGFPKRQQFGRPPVNKM